MKKLLFLIILLLTVLTTSCKKDDPITTVKRPATDSLNVVQNGAISRDYVYYLLRGYADNSLNYPASEYVYFIQMSTDELCVPVRKGGDWYNGGQYIEMLNHTWTPANQIILSAWKYYYNIISNCNIYMLLQQNTLQSQAEIRLLRAYAYYHLLDLFGNVPLITEKTASGVVPANSTRQQVYAFIDSELNDPIMTNLPLKQNVQQVSYYYTWSTTPVKSGVMNQRVLNVLKARLYLNSQAFGGNARWQDCITACDNVINSGQYSLENNVYANFYVDNESSKENILTISYDGQTTTGNYLQMLSYDFYQGTAFGASIFGNCVNGPCVAPRGNSNVPGLYDIFAPNDIRRLSMLTGQQYNLTTGKTIIHLGDSINYAPNFTGGFVAAAATTASLASKRGDGARIIKYELVSSQNWEMANDWVLMRYAEVLYMKAECLIRLGQSEEARPIFQSVLATRGFNPSTTITPAIWMSKRSLTPTDLTSIIPTNITLDFMDQELRREFIFEDHRRTDMIRMGKYLGAWGMKATPDGDSHTLLFPIPTAILSTSPNLIQNPGY
jgi:hypothetical protein